MPGVQAKINAKDTSAKFKEAKALTAGFVEQITRNKDAKKRFDRNCSRP